MTQLTPGTRIRFLKTLDAPANEESPAVVYAEKGDTGEVVENPNVPGGGPPREGHWVKWDRWPHPFGAVLGEEFEPIA